MFCFSFSIAFTSVTDISPFQAVSRIDSWIQLKAKRSSPDLSWSFLIFPDLPICPGPAALPLVIVPFSLSFSKTSPGKLLHWRAFGRLHLSFGIRPPLSTIWQMIGSSAANRPSIPSPGIVRQDESCPLPTAVGNPVPDCRLIASCGALSSQSLERSNRCPIDCQTSGTCFPEAGPMKQPTGLINDFNYCFCFMLFFILFTLFLFDLPWSLLFFSVKIASPPEVSGTYSWSHLPEKSWHTHKKTPESLFSGVLSLNHGCHSLCQKSA